VLGRTDQLLPVVCNPGATISPNSKLKMLGKTPSLYNRDRLATGIKHWTEHVVTEHDFARWSNEPDYGICVRTVNGWLALDCDSEDEDMQPIFAKRWCTAGRVAAASLARQQQQMPVPAGRGRRFP
jgi:hypothetical protein